jgi:hypothetical protein
MGRDESANITVTGPRGGSFDNHSMILSDDKNVST